MTRTPAARVLIAVGTLQLVLWMGFVMSGLWLAAHNFTFWVPPDGPGWTHVGVRRGLLVAGVAAVGAAVGTVLIWRVLESAPHAVESAVSWNFAGHVAVMTPSAAVLWAVGPDILATSVLTALALLLIAAVVAASLRAGVRGSDRDAQG